MPELTSGMLYTMPAAAAVVDIVPQNGVEQGRRSFDVERVPPRDARRHTENVERASLNPNRAVSVILCSSRPPSFPFTIARQLDPKPNHDPKHDEQQSIQCHENLSPAFQKDMTTRRSISCQRTSPLPENSSPQLLSALRTFCEAILLNSSELLSFISISQW